jgi:hypothetical protein
MTKLARQNPWRGTIAKAKSRSRSLREKNDGLEVVYGAPYVVGTWNRRGAEQPHLTGNYGKDDRRAARDAVAD